MARALPAILMLFVPLLLAPAAAQVSGGMGSEGSYSGQYEDQGKEGGFDPSKLHSGPDAHADELATGADLVKQEKFADAIPHLERAEEKSPRNVTVLIYLGFAHRMLGEHVTLEGSTAEYDKALGYYRKGLDIDPRNKLLHEYLGKLYLLMRQYSDASDELKKLSDLCSSDCPERDSLSQAIAANPPAAAPSK
jgi:tetratricopeptide (TPR) repeat protein